MSELEKFVSITENSVLKSLFGDDDSANISPSSSGRSSPIFAEEEMAEVQIVLAKSIIHPDYSIRIAERKSLGIAHQLWPASIFLGDYLAANPNLLNFKQPDSDTSNINIIELGAGLGLTGLFLASFYDDNKSNVRISKVILTDLPEAIDGLRENIKLNNLQHRVVAKVLSWGNLEEVHDTLSMCSGVHNVVIAADVIYWEKLFVPLVDTLACLCKQYGCIVIIAHIKRWKKDNKFLNLCKKQALLVDTICEEINFLRHENTHEEMKQIRRIYKISAIK